MEELWNFLAEETRQSFSDLQNLVLALDGKASTLLAIDAILLTAFSLIPNVTHFNLINRVIIFIPLILSTLSAICCLYLRKWYIIDGNKLVAEYEYAGDIDYVACEIVKTRADLEAKLLGVQKDKSVCLHISMLFTILASVVGVYFHLPFFRSSDSLTRVVILGLGFTFAGSTVFLTTGLT